jgi:hypothetical protein
VKEKVKTATSRFEVYITWAGFHSYEITDGRAWAKGVHGRSCLIGPEESSPLGQTVEDETPWTLPGEVTSLAEDD